MKKKLIYLILILLFTQLFIVSAKNKLDYVKTLMGTQSLHNLSNGNTLPLVARPWGMNFWTPQTNNMGDGWTYTYTAEKIKGFKQTHQPSPWMNDYGQFALMPITGKICFDQNERASWFSHKAEIAKPNYYRVYLADHDVQTELTTTERSAMFRFIFPKTDSASVVIDAYDKGSFVEIIGNENKIVGYTTRNSGGVPENFKNYFVITFDKPFSYTFQIKDGMIDNNGANPCNHAGAIIGFETTKGEIVHARVASSFISIEQAELNLKEQGNKKFDDLVNEGAKIWNDLLNVIDVEGGTDEQYHTFYSCMYRTLLFPRKLYEINKLGEVIHYSPFNGQVLAGYMYTDTGFWDTFRSLFPFLNLVFPSVNKEIQEALLNTYKESGFFPEWASPGHRDCMVGNNSASVLADAYLKGVEVSDIKAVYEGMIKGAHNRHPQIGATGRNGHNYYDKLGYVPANVGINESAARTLEYAYNDWCIYQLAKKIKRSRKEIDYYAKRAMNYKNLYDSNNYLMRGRNEDGTFVSPFSPFKWGGDFTEGNSLHYTWSVFHDVQGLIDLMGGNTKFTQMLDTVFVLPPIFDESYYGSVIHEIREMQIAQMGNYAHGNQPIQHMIYLYNYAGQPWKAQYWVREVMNRMYNSAPDGYCGDEDNGQTSAWYVFSALGFYPVCPGTDQYVIGSPLFKKATLNFENGQNLVIEAPDNTTSTPYINYIRHNGIEYPYNYLTHDMLLKGGKIEFNMVSQPNTLRGISPKTFPYSFSNSIK